jgi:plasmid replication initiation protein
MNGIDLLFETRKQWSDFQIHLLLELIHKVEQGDNSYKVYKVKAKDILFQKISFETLQIETQIFFHKVYLVTDTNRLTQVSIFSSVTFLVGEGIIEIVLPPLIKTYFLALKNQYTLVTIKNILNFKSLYSKKLYLILKGFEEENITITVEDLKNQLNVTEVYRDYNTFKKRIILQAQKELHLTDIPFFFQEIKVSKRIVSIQFIKTAIHHIPISNEQIELQDKLIKDTKITALQAKRIVIKFTAQEIYSALYMIKDLEYSKRIKTNLAAYVVGVFNKKLLNKY